MNTLMNRTNGNGYVPTTAFSGLVDKIFHNNVNRIFDDQFWGFNNLSQHTSVPANVQETDLSYELELVAPGLKKDDFKINLQGDLLTISFDHEEEQSHHSNEEGWLRREYQKRSFTRSFNLEGAIDAAKITANYSNGMLHLSMPKKEGTQRISRTIQIS